MKIGELSSEDVLAYIREMERYLKITVETRANEEEAPKSKDELVYQEEVIDTGDYGWNGDLSFPEPRTPQIQESTDGTEKEEEAVDPDGEGDDEEELLVTDEAELED
ncbi:MAG: hypothetical protein JNK87_28785 [Bryobacterales bacterium]|nr:hypothetical protein [Bryobacterales bacterium]